MAVFTVAKTVGAAASNFSTPQLWEDGAPASLTTAEKSAAGTFLTAAFVQGEALSFVGSGATGKLIDTDSTGAGNGTYVSYGLITGNPAASDVVTGGTSGATCVLSSGTPTDVGCIWQGQQKNEEFSGTGVQLTVAGSTDSSTAYKEYTTLAGASFVDNANKLTNPLRYDATAGAAIRGTSIDTATISHGENNFRLNKMQVTATGSGGRAMSGAAPTTTGIHNQNIYEGTYVGTSAGIGVVASGSITVRNSLIIQRASAADHIVGTGTGTPAFYNCTIAAADDLATAPTRIFLSGASGTVTVQNCALFAGDSTKALKAGSATFNFTTCFSDISGTAGVTQTSYTTAFVDITDAARDFRLKNGAALVDTGTTDATNAATDIVGTARPENAAYDVGCWELAAASLVRTVKMAGEWGGYAGASGGRAG